ncbi:(Fe-S)-binding protein [Clostridium sp. P21]|uniref:(Fe-S)-binding protein n=1 Tax=Clostridium muellerianum TaxID=2716538 RepID=A0A7Y0EII9_9CLOT|nr:EFR1 family ferrodoxin [Clostridium muellerianum]NMM64115.1 (Fe-S)-binding protein [Clostridium muellerianum]
MKGVLYYFSGTGNTKWAADIFKKYFNNNKVDLHLLNIEKIEEVKIKEFDFLIIGSSVYADIEPKIVDDFLKKFPKSTKKLKTIVYVTQGGKSSSAASIIAEKLKVKGYNVLIEESIKMPNNYYFLLNKEPNVNEYEKILTDAEDRVKKTVQNFIENNKLKRQNSFIRIKLGKLCGNSFRRVIPRISKNITVTSECTKCGLCLTNCPKSNITFEDGKPVFHSKCMLCLRCIYICPVNVVRYKGKKIEQIQKERVKGVIKCQ